MASLDMKKKKVLNFEGLMAAPFTAFKENGDVNAEIIPNYAKYLADHNVNGVYVNGTTGEWLSLNVDERKKNALQWLTGGRDSMKVVVIHVTANNMNDTKDLARHAEQNNADAIAILPPIYYKPDNNAQLINYLKEVSSAAPKTPLIYYHIPSMSGVNINLNNFISEARPLVPNFCGAKYTSSDIKDLAYCQAHHGNDFKFMIGCDELWIAALSIGVNTAVGITHNMMADANYEVFKHFKDNDMKKALVSQMKLNNMMERLLKWGTLFPVLKAAMNEMTPINVGYVRSPMVPLNETNKNNLIKEIKLINSI